MSERALLADILAMIAGGAIVIWGVSLFWGPAIWALLPWLAIGAYIVYRYRPQWFAWAREFARGISSRIPDWNSRFAPERQTPLSPLAKKGDSHTRAGSGHHVDETAKAEHVAPVMFAAATGKGFWTGVSGIARVLGNFPILWVIAAVLFGLAWGEWRYRDGRRDGGHEVRNQYAESDRRAALRREDAQKEVAAIGTEHAVNRERIAANAQRGRDEIARAAPQVETPLDADLERAYRSALRRLCLYPENGQLAPGCGSGA